MSGGRASPWRNCARSHVPGLSISRCTPTTGLRLLDEQAGHCCQEVCGGSCDVGGGGFGLGLVIGDGAVGPPVSAKSPDESQVTMMADLLAEKVPDIGREGGHLLAGFQPGSDGSIPTAGGCPPRTKSPGQPDMAARCQPQMAEPKPSPPPPLRAHRRPPHPSTTPSPKPDQLLPPRPHQSPDGTSRGQLSKSNRSKSRCVIAAAARLCLYACSHGLTGR